MLVVRSFAVVLFFLAAAVAAQATPPGAHNGADSSAHNGGNGKEITVTSEMPVRGEQVSIVGIYESAGNGVECPKVRADDGRVFGVSSIPTDIELGARVKIAGPIVVMTTCLGDVIYVEEFAELTD